jgi:undecaprenyl-diphosphatase
MLHSEFNLTMLRVINNLGKEFPIFNPLAIFFAEHMVFVLAAILLFYWLTGSHYDKKMVVGGALAFFLAEVIAKTIGFLYSHHQPFALFPNINQLIPHEIDNSFPSDHTILFFSFAVSTFLHHKRRGLILLFVAALVGLSRIWVGVHYPVDVLFGVLIATISAILSFIFLKQITEKIVRFYESVEAFLFSKNRRKEKNHF